MIVLDSLKQLLNAVRDKLPSEGVGVDCRKHMKWLWNETWMPSLAPHLRAGATILWLYAFSFFGFLREIWAQGKNIRQGWATFLSVSSIICLLSCEVAAVHLVWDKSAIFLVLCPCGLCSIIQICASKCCFKTLRLRILFFNSVGPYLT